MTAFKTDFSHTRLDTTREKLHKAAVQQLHLLTCTIVDFAGSEVFASLQRIDPDFSGIIMENISVPCNFEVDALFRNVQGFVLFVLYRYEGCIPLDLHFEKRRGRRYRHEC